MNVYEKIGLQRVINASGRMTVLGVSTISDEVAKAAKEGGQSYVVMEDLMVRSGEIISTYTGAEDSCVTSSASAGICMSVAGIISRGKKSIVERLPDSSGLPNEVIIQRGHCVSFGAPIESMIRIGGGKPVCVGMVNHVDAEDIEEAITSKTVALMYIKSHHCVQKGMQSLETMLEMAHAHGLPLIVDAAAEEDLRKYIALGADLVIYSGAKALEATTSGFITGKREYIQWARQQTHGIARPMKIGKEGIMGLIKALELYANKDNKEAVRRQKETVQYFIEQINLLPGCYASQIQDEAGRDIYRCKVVVDSTKAKKSAIRIDQELRQGQVVVHQRGYLLDQGIMMFDPRPLVEGDKELIVEKLKEILT